MRIHPSMLVFVVLVISSLACSLPTGATPTGEPVSQPSATAEQRAPQPSAINDKYDDLGGEDGILGPALGEEKDTADGGGRYRDFKNGSIYWTAETGAFQVGGLIWGKWTGPDGLGGSGGFLGYPTTDELTAPDGRGRYNHFQHGSIYWTPETGAFELHGLIYAKWEQLGWEASFLGYPTSDELTAEDGRGRYNNFEGGAIYWTSETGAHEVHGFIQGKWKELGAEKSKLGYPVSDEEPSTDTGWERQSRFEHGVIRWSAQKGAEVFDQ